MILESTQLQLMSIRPEIRTHSRICVKMVGRALSNSQSTGSSHEWRTLTYQLEPSDTTASFSWYEAEEASVSLLCLMLVMLLIVEVTGCHL